MYRIAITTVATIFATGLATAYAGTDDDKRAAANVKLDRSVRIAACTRLIDNAELTDQEHAQAYLQRGILLRLNKAWDEAMSDFDRCVELDPGNPSAQKNRGFVYFNTGKYTTAEAEFSEALKVEPRNKEHFYYRARARSQLKKYSEAIADYTQALVFDPRYFAAYTGRARAHWYNTNYDLAVADCDAALSLSPYVADAYFVRGLAKEELLQRDGAIHDYCVAFSLDPNIDGPESGLKRLSAVSGPAEAGQPVAFAPPANGVAITYLQTRRKQASEADEFMADLIGWFKQKRVPDPTKRLFLTRKILMSVDDISKVEASHRYEETDGTLNVSAFNYYRSIWPTVLHGPAGLSMDINLDVEPIKALWPLAPAKQGVVTGKLEFVGPDPLTPQAIFMGCKKPGDRIAMGTTSWKGGVVGWETVVVPAGIFKTLKLESEEAVELNFFGRKNKVTSTVTMWYAPSVRWWVKRVRSGDGNLVIDEATVIQ